MSATLYRIVIEGALCEAFYRFMGSDGLLQTAAVSFVYDPTALQATAQAAVDAAFASASAAHTAPSDIVAHMTQLGQIKTQTAKAQEDLAAAQGQLAAARAQVAAAQAAAKAAVP